MHLIPYQEQSFSDLKLVNCSDLFLQSNQFTGNIPTAIGELESLYNLNMSDNRIRGTIPTQIGKLRRLRDCSLFNNRIKGRIPDEIGDLTGESWNHLIVSYN